MKFFTFVFSALLFAAPQVMSQINVYDVIVAGRTIGSLKVFDNQTKDNVETHRIESNFKILFYKGKYSTQTNFVQGKLVSAVCAHEVNGDLKEKTQTKSSVKTLYEVLFSGEDAGDTPRKEFNSPINNTVTSLYYKEPVNLNEVYSERYGQMCSIKKISEGNYGVSLPDGKQGIYTYKNGLCKEVKTDLAGFKLRIVLNEGKNALR